MARLLLIDTSDELPGLLPLHAWSALSAAAVVLVRGADHPFAPHLEMAERSFEVVPPPPEATSAPRSRTELLSGLSSPDKRRAEWIVDRAREAGDAAYLFGPADDEAFTRTLGMEAARAQVEVEIVYFMAAPRGLRVLNLVEVQEQLLEPGGCPWDREQTHASLAQYAVEEVFELVDAISREDTEAIAEELGDVLLQVTFHAELAHRAGGFSIDDVAEGIVAKLVRRHPHVFGDAEVADAAEVVDNWETIKAEEKPGRDGPFDGIPRGVPATSYATALLVRAARRGLPLPGGSPSEVRRQADAVAAAEGPDLDDALGELLMAVVALAHERGVDPETALRAAATRFRRAAEADIADAGTTTADPGES